jgi:hypothetical protein
MRQLTAPKSAWVKKDGSAMSALLPLYPQKPAFIAIGGADDLYSFTDLPPRILTGPKAACKIPSRPTG